MAFGVATTPGFLASDRSGIGVAAVLLVLAGYAVAGRMAPALERREPVALAWAQRFGLAAAGVYVAETLLEYALTPADNTAWGVVEFGLVFLAYAAAGAAVAWRTGRWRSAALGGAGAAMGSAVVWYVAVLAAHYAFRGTTRQMAVLGAEGDFDDFRRSGLADLQVFLMGDFLGAGIFHLLLSPFAGALLGVAGGSLGLTARAVGRRGRRAGAAP